MSFTPLVRLVYTHQIDRLVIVGLATDYCVRATAIDSRKFGIGTEVGRSSRLGDARLYDARIYTPCQLGWVRADANAGAVKCLETHLVLSTAFPSLVCFLR
ncbi:Isochorismatase domain-containing protein [Rhizoctonia solani AG-1 IA]|uniref:Isochorismatase domain-containing protein n=1 Tax=Thanatephorus cucumeris (strain AG1-IA) TaxID=983506 RepID=L8X973_THACA|nr:Isochorismatase domain-containing protein [Rhizoctonia solani AG-1 IA]